MLDLFPHKITYWAPNGTDDFSVEVFDEPALLDGRWEDKTETKRTPQGDEFTSQARVFLSEPVSEGGWIAKGDYTLYNSPHHGAVKGAQEVRSTETIPDLRGLSEEYRAYL